MDKMVTLERQNSGWSSWSKRRCNLSEALIWLADHHYKAVKARTMTTGRREIRFQKTGCQTTYRIYF